MTKYLALFITGFLAVGSASAQCRETRQNLGTFGHGQTISQAQSDSKRGLAQFCRDISGGAGTVTNFSLVSSQDPVSKRWTTRIQGTCEYGKCKVGKQPIKG